MKIVTKFAMFCIRSWVRFMFKPKAYFVDKKVQTNHLKKPCVIIANHTSTKDALFLFLVLKGKKNVIVAKDWYEKKNSTGFWQEKELFLVTDLILIQNGFSWPEKILKLENLLLSSLKEKHARTGS